MASGYDPKEIEKKWQEVWAATKLYATTDDSNKPKTYVLDMFPYPSGEGLHVGHPKGYIATDVYARHMRMRGHSVLHPMGWDAFGLPAENFAIKTKIHPRVAVEKNIARFKEQLAGIGFDYDWSREINTTDPAYYTWTQWIFLQMFKKGLAFQSNEPINWCPSCMTGLANEDLDGTVCERCGTEVEKKSLPQWVLKITAYADRMLADLDSLRWPEHIKEAQRNWIGRSEGAHIEFSIAGSDKKIKVFTTRPDTLFGATYMVLAPEHALVKELPISNRADVDAYVASASAKSEIERTDAGKDKTGVELKGVKAMNPANKEEIPVYVADYVLGGYGTGAIMAVPAHDERDYEFAKKFNIPIVQVIEPKFFGSKEVIEKKFGTTRGDEVRPDMEFVRREAVCAVVRNPKDDTYLCVSWKSNHMNGLVTGGIEAGEDIVEAARREVAEETGYKNLKFVRTSPVAINTFFYHRVKKQNRWAHFTFVFFDLENDECQAIDEQETALHEIVWKKKEELKSFFTVFEGDFVVDLLNDREYVHTGPGMLSNSGTFNRLDSEEAKKKITELVGGVLTTTYKLKDWVFSRQRYWGEPIPIIHCEKCGAVGVPEKDLPVLLPEVTSYEPSGTGESPLATIAEWVNTTCPECNGPAKRETNTMPQWAGSSWYYLRFIDPQNSEALVAKDKEKFWAPVDVYVGGDHAVRHLIYARFWHKFLYDIGSVSTIEPFARLEFLGFILAEDGRKMSKRHGNIIDPQTVVAEYGADTFRVYEMFMGPFENTVAWSTTSIVGTKRFIKRVWKAAELVQDAPATDLDTPLHQTIKKVGDDIETFKFNTAVSQMMIFLNELEKSGSIGKEQWQSFLQLLAPFAPHVTEELWARLGNASSVHLSQWPQFDEKKILASVVEVAVQVNGKVRGSVLLHPDATEAQALSAARADTNVAKWLSGGSEKKAVYVKGRIVSFVVEQS
jgi:leucyl-tRNA synthetase